uniref:Putative secreted protein n=1 Tax=Anopheles marajoara TaxID=58244 RepID=A0A2M4C8X6_9DIPT
MIDILYICLFLSFLDSLREAVFGNTRRGQRMLLCEGHGYVREKQKGTISNWKCSLHSKYKCKARAVTNESQGKVLMRLTCGIHSHGAYTHIDSKNVKRL